MDEISQEEHRGCKMGNKPRPEPQGTAKIEEEAKKDASMKEKAEHVTTGLTQGWREKTYAHQVSSYLAVRGLMTDPFRCSMKKQGSGNEAREGSESFRSQLGPGAIV